MDKDKLKEMSDDEFHKVLHDVEPGLCDQQGISCGRCIKIEAARKHGLSGGAFTCAAITEEADRRNFAYNTWTGLKNAGGKKIGG